ncbi:hypothetical protein KGF56_001611 [Candida oxycetoniae]|uniref:Amino acid permease/ SLC12A domain-containing protein n=1 Tax=Candida oxycetoniae TaxID=497107 RepID=A0AAI9SYK8_9ASCO|nr:uncharacterized protein KGF56_001611 [Candida oxycetoniae]KAI3405593.2 hypothetical protein KGF56_001611 [Candida oxycetoniae]
MVSLTKNVMSDVEPQVSLALSNISSYENRNSGDGGGDGGGGCGDGDDCDGDGYNGQHPLFNTRGIFYRFIDSFKPFDYSTLPPVYLAHFNEQQKLRRESDSRNNGEDMTSSHFDKDSYQGLLHPAHPDFDYSKFSQLERDSLITAMSPLRKRLQTRHLTWISLGACIGTGLFITSGKSLHHAGPLGLLLVWIFIGSLVFTTMSSLSELATAFPVSGAFVTFPSLFIDRAVGFAIAWNYALQWLVTLPLELVAASMLIQYWNASINPGVFVTIFYCVIVLINLFGVKGYGEIESLMSIAKVIGVIGFNILAIVIVTGGVPNQPYIGGANWHSPRGGLFNTVEPFKQMCYIISSASFAYAGIELFALGAVESSTPKISINKSRKQIFYRIVCFYLVSIVMIGLLVSYKSEELDVSAAGLTSFGISVNTSPFVIAIKNANIHVLPSIMNAVVIITVLSVGNASVFASTRVLNAIGALSQGPKFLCFIDKKGRPMGCLIVQFAFGLLAYLVCIPGRTTEVTIFEWMLSLSGLSALFTYLSINICQLRFHSALDYQARSPKLELLYVSSPWCSWYAIIAICITLVLQFWAALSPPGDDGKIDVVSFFKIYLGLPVLILSYLGYKIYDYKYNQVPFTKLWLSANEIDVDSGRRQVDLEVVKQEIAERSNTLDSKPWWFKLYHFFC